MLKLCHRRRNVLFLSALLSFPSSGALVPLSNHVIRKPKGALPFLSPTRFDGVTNSRRRWRCSIVVVSAAPNGEEKDLFEYFDPRISPHMYPNGINPEESPPPRPTSQSGRRSVDAPQQDILGIHAFVKEALERDEEAEEGDVMKEEELRPPPRELLEDFDPLLSPHEYPDGIDARIGTAGIQETKQREEEAEAAEDLLDYFDPRLSPHRYPDGIDGSQGRGQLSDETENEEESTWNPLRLNVKDDFRDTSTKSISSRRASSNSSSPTTPSASKLAVKSAPSTKTETGAEKKKKEKEQKRDLFDVFDPRLSPHSYPDGIPEHSTDPTVVASATYEAFSSTQMTPSGVEQTRTMEKVGVLLIDHGSKREASNLYLEKLAATYGERSPDHYVVKAAHMELCEPTVEEGIRCLIEEEGVGRIVCHPYFLSPGRHVTEDIPSLLSDAVESISRPDVPVVLTDPIGSSMDVMVNAIATLVEDTLGEMEEEDMEEGE